MGCCATTSRVLIDAEMDRPVVAEIGEVVDALPVKADIADLHVWRVGRDKYACILSLIVEETLEPDAVRQALSVHEELVHVTVEVNRRR
jgi:Co/Zn/Cd efflux system component